MLTVTGDLTAAALPREFSVAVVHIRDKRPGNGRFQSELDRLNRGIVRAADDLGWSAALIPAARMGAQRVVDEALAADAVVIAGGEDVDPRLYAGDEVYEGASEHQPRADRAQIAVVRGAMRRFVPLLGICRGMQVINVALGGDLVAHLPCADLHRAPVGSAGSYVRGSVVWDPGYAASTEFGERSLLEDVDVEEPVFCTHHQGVGEIAKGLRVAARAPDGTVEAIVGTETPVTGVQWHPEHTDAPRDQMRRLLLRLAHQRALYAGG